MCSLLGRNVAPGLRSTCRDRQSVPRGDLDDQIQQLRELVGAEGRGSLLDGGRSYLLVGEKGDGFGQRQGPPLTVGEERRLAPGAQCVETLFGLTLPSGVLGVHVDAVRTAVDL